MPAQLAGEDVTLELGVWWAHQRPAIYGCFHGAPWRFRILPQHPLTQVDTDDRTTYLTRSLAGGDCDDIVDGLLDELEHAAEVARS